MKTDHGLVSSKRRWVVDLSCYDFEWLLVWVVVQFRSNSFPDFDHKGAPNCHMLLLSNCPNWALSLSPLLLTASHTLQTHWRMTKNAAATSLLNLQPNDVAANLQSGMLSMFFFFSSMWLLFLHNKAGWQTFRPTTHPSLFNNFKTQIHPIGSAMATWCWSWRSQPSAQP